MQSASPLKIALGNLMHTTIGRHSAYMPIGLGYLAAYLKDRLKGAALEIRIFDEPESLHEAIMLWRPHILGISNYAWNSQVASLMFRQAKQAIPHLITLSGGPNIGLGHDERQAFMTRHPWLDYYAILEGEEPLKRLVEKIAALREEGSDPHQLRREPQAGFLSLHPETGAFLMGEELPRLKNLDEIPSPYLTGLMDEWFDGDRVPCLETARGCPFHCTFCVQGRDPWNRVNRFSMARLKAEFRYMAQRMVEHPHVMLALCDTNFGMYPWDEEIGDYFRALFDEFGWPDKVVSSLGKENHDRIMRIAERTGNRLRVISSVQSWNEQTLTAIKRRNPTREKFIHIQDNLIEKGLNTCSEAIVPLPEETRESFFDGIRTLFESRVEVIAVYSTMLLQGSELASAESRERYAMETRYRLIPRQFGTYGGEKCFEIEEICVATNTLSYAEYLECRGCSLVLALLPLDQFDLCHRLLDEMGLEKYDWFLACWERIRDDAGELGQIYQGFVTETEEELFPTEQALIDHFSVEAHYAELLSGDAGDNLIRKYRGLLISRANVACLELAFEVLREMAPSARWRSAVEDVLRWSITMRDIGTIFSQGLRGDHVEELANFTYDVAEWYGANGAGDSLLSYRGDVQYRMANSDLSVELVQQQQRLYHDPALALARYFDHYQIRQLWRVCEVVTPPLYVATDVSRTS
ncbi:MAG: radical SAM protein [Magnetococcales bacterium]|nr:radical SAM protein [Magnetococcales bacterium]